MGMDQGKRTAVLTASGRHWGGLTNSSPPFRRALSLIKLHEHGISISALSAATDITLAEQCHPSSMITHAPAAKGARTTRH